MNTKTCKTCGWVYPIKQVGLKCKICGTPFDIVTCTTCGRPLPKEDIKRNSSMCKECYYNRYRQGNTISNRAHRARVRAKRIARFDEWIAKVQAVPKDYPTLTEAQWLEACRHFDGCARCHSEIVDTRGFFISAKLGGRYCDWNVIPLCEKCAVNWDLARNAFINASSRDRNSGISCNHEYRDCLEGVVEYLGRKLDEASGASQKSEESAE